MTAEHLNNDVKNTLRVVFGANTVATNATDNAINVINNRINTIDDSIDIKDIVNAQDYVENDRSSQLVTHLQHCNLAWEQGFSSAKNGFEIQYLLENLLQNAYQHDKVVNNIIAVSEQGFWKLSAELTKQSFKLAMRDLTVDKNDNSKRLYVRIKYTYQIIRLYSYFCCNNTTIHLYLATQCLKKCFTNCKKLILVWHDKLLQVVCN